MDMRAVLKSISKALHQESAFQLPSVTTLPDWALTGWIERLVAYLEPLEREKIQNFRYMWGAENLGPNQGVPSSMAEIGWLVEEGKLDIQEMVDFQIIDSEESLSNLITTEITPDTSEDGKKAADRLVQYISGGVYKSGTTAGQAYNSFVKDVEVNRRIIEGFRFFVPLLPSPGNRGLFRQ